MTSRLEYHYEPTPDDIDAMVLHDAVTGLEELARRKRCVTAYDIEQLEAIERAARTIREGAKQ